MGLGGHPGPNRRSMARIGAPALTAWQAGSPCYVDPMTASSRPKPLITLLAVLAATIAIMLAMGRPPICTCGTVELWGEVGPKQSQMLADWYSPSHIIHGFLFYALLAWLWPRAPIERR